jgi:hypothetical protein
MILGMNWLKAFNPQINLEEETLWFDRRGSIWAEEPQVQEISQMAVNATMSHSQRLNQEHEKKADTPPKTIE